MQPKMGLCTLCNEKYGSIPPSRWQSAWSKAVTDALAKYCKANCPDLTPDMLECMAFAESDDVPGPGATTDGNRGLFQISSDIWGAYSCNSIGPYFPSVYDPLKNIECAIKILCKYPSGSGRGFHCSIAAWGTHTTGKKGIKYQCCMLCKTK